jgi:hypothetical protein
MSGQEPSDLSHRLSEQQRSGLEERQTHQGRTLDAMHQLEAALSEAAPGREQEWRESVLEAVVVLETATSEEKQNAERPDSLLSDLAHNQPRLRNRARALRIQYQKLCENLSSLRHELEQQHDSGVDYADVRQRLGWALMALRHQRARESDLIYEAYYDAFNVELRYPDSGGRP